MIPEKVNPQTQKADWYDANGWEERGMGSDLFNGYSFEVFFCGDEDILKSDIGDSCTICECTKCHWIVHWKIVNFVVHEFYPND